MEITVSQSMKRAKRIDSVEKSLREIEEDEELLLNEKEFVILICEQFTCSERLAKEYIRIAKSRMEIKNGTNN